MAEGITTDNYPPEAYQRYARDQQALDTTFTTDLQQIPRRTEISVATPYIPANEEERFLIGQMSIWANFEPLPNFLASSIFTHLLAPSLGTTEKLQKLLDYFDTLRDSFSSDPQDDKEYQTIRDFLKTTYIPLSRTSDLINAERNRHQKG